MLKRLFLSGKICQGKFHFLGTDGDRLVLGGRGKISQVVLFENTARMVEVDTPLFLPEQPTHYSPPPPPKKAYQINFKYLWQSG